MEVLQKPRYLSNLEYIRILTPYVFSCSLVAGKFILDIGCGSGYGTWLLAKRSAEQVVAFDLERENIRQLSQLCANLENISNLAMDGQRLGFKNQSYEVLTCFEVIEHVPKPDILLSELRRVLKEDGILILTTPNRKMRLRPLQSPWNPEHLREYTFKTLDKKLQNHFPTFTILGIYCEPKISEFYRRRWLQSHFHVYFGWAWSRMKAFIPAAVRNRIRLYLGRGNSNSFHRSDIDLSNMAVPAPDPVNWPFYVSDLKKDDCLNIIAICGFDDRIVQKAAHEMKQSAWKLSKS